MKSFLSFPSDKRILEIQQEELSYYWTKCFENFLRKHGLVYIPSHFQACLRFIGRKTESDYTNVPFSIIECPEKGRGIEFSSCEYESDIVHLYDHEKNYIGTFGYPKIRLRRIPPSGEKYKEPYLYVDEKKHNSHRPIRWQSFHGERSEHVYAYVKKEDDDIFYPCIIEKDNKLLLGLPLFDLVGVAASFPSLEEGYYDTLISSMNYITERFFFQKIISYLIKYNIHHVLANIWPKGFQSCFTLRHDYDRRIPLFKHAVMMIGYKIMGVKTSFSLLHYNIQTWHCRLLKLFGHEINLHCTTSTAKDFQKELKDVQKKSGTSFLGMTCHGGQGARGWLGDTHYDLLENNHLCYGEILGRQTGIPQKVNRIQNNIPFVSSLYIPASHMSIDAGMKKNQHYLDDLLISIPKSLKLGEHVVLMSHPDIHIKEVFKLLFKTLTKHCWRTTFKDSLSWTQNVRYDAMIFECKNTLTVHIKKQIKLMPVYHYFKNNEYHFIKFIEEKEFNIGLIAL